MYKKFAVDVEQVVNKYKSKYGLAGFNFGCALLETDGKEFILLNGKKTYSYTCYGTAADRKDNVYINFLMEEPDYAEFTARDMAFICIGVASEEVSKRLQGVNNNV